MSHQASIACIVASNILALVVCVSWLFEPAPTITQHNVGWRGADDQPRTVFRRGEIAYIKRDVCTNREVNVQTFRRVNSVDERDGIALEGGGGKIKGCKSFTYAFFVQDILPPKSYYLRVTLRVDTNPLRTDTVVLDSPPIEVIE